MCEQSNCKCTPQSKEDYSSIDYQLSILKAAKEGKEIETRAASPSCGWIVFNKSIPFNFKANHYRIKREPKVIWVNEYTSMGGWKIHPTKSNAEACAAGMALREAVKYIEVMED